MEIKKDVTRNCKLCGALLPTWYLENICTDCLSNPADKDNELNRLITINTEQTLQKRPRL